MILIKLKKTTQTQHEALERALNLTDPMLEWNDYRRLLTRFYGFYEPLEAGLASAVNWCAVQYDFEARRKTPRLVRDLQSLGLHASDIEALPRCRALPGINSLGDALGILYVLEGATLGGQLLARHFHKTLGLTASAGAAFFAGYGMETGARWMEFGAFLRACVTDNEREEAALAAAQETFTRLQEWLIG